ncbi:hypothetical protein GCM10010302_16940 [Streptomyces polychromogenes]|uniref:Uncharacterized protein n=1 Tax=Streptomyces polychromogenes TaxID=67342 RepID=A0ABP3EUS0_9ACTN
MKRPRRVPAADEPAFELDGSSVVGISAEAQYLLGVGRVWGGHGTLSCSWGPRAAKAVRGPGRGCFGVMQGRGANGPRRPGRAAGATVARLPESVGPRCGGRG